KLDSYDDENFLVLISGVPHLCKVHNGVESDSPAVIDYQNRIMLHLNEAPGVRTTEPLKTAAGELSVTLPLPVLSAAHSPHPLTVRLLTYIPGTPLAYTPVSPPLLESCGAYLAEVDRALDGFEHPAADRFHIWCTEHTLALRPFLEHVQTDARRALVASVVARFESEVLPAAGEFRRAVLQSDFNDANVIVGEDGEIAGVIDFGDSVRR
ncbi:hypothetical protein TeGR_g2829, partial [Tetraparma gracilis]